MSEIIHGNNIEILRTFPDNSVDSVVTDPPYGLSFMNKHWDYDVPSVDLWKECLRVLKPGGHLLSFAGTRTYHRMTVRIEDAGFEIRDMISWIYGSGFPKSLDIGKAIDKVNGETGRILKFVKWFRTTGLKQKETNQIIGKSDVGSHYLRLDQPAIPTAELWAKLRPHIKIEIPKWVDELVERIEAEREVIGEKKDPDGKSRSARLVNKCVNANAWNLLDTDDKLNKATYATAPATPEAIQWNGWGTALKPACEPICVARKPVIGTIANNVLTYGTGGINIDASRINTTDQENGVSSCKNLFSPDYFSHKSFYGLKQLHDFYLHIFSVLDSCNTKDKDLLHNSVLIDYSLSIQFEGVSYDLNRLYDYGVSYAHKLKEVPSFLNDYPTLCRFYDGQFHLGAIPVSDAFALLNDVRKYISRCQDLLKNNSSDCNTLHLFAFWVFPFHLFGLVYKEILHKYTKYLSNTQGRFPANIIFDEISSVLLDEMSGELKSGERKGGDKYKLGRYENQKGHWGLSEGKSCESSSGGASRFFYCAKSSRGERNNGLDCYLTVKYIADKKQCKEENTVAVQLLKRVMSDTVQVSFNTVENGVSIMGLCHQECLSTILTEINGIIELKILNSLTLLLTNEYTPAVKSEKVNGGNLAESAENLKKWLLTITNGNQELARGANSVALKMLLLIKEKENWKELSNFHATVKPLKLMQYLVRLVTPPKGICLDPFAGSGTTGMACEKENFDYILCEREAEYIPIIKARIEWIKKQKKEIPEQTSLFKPL